MFEIVGPMVTAKKGRAGEASAVSNAAANSIPKSAIALGLVLMIVGLIIAFFKSPLHMAEVLSIPSAIGTNKTPSSSTPPPKPGTRLTREGIELLLESLDQAIRRKDVEGVLGHIAPNATITIHMRQGSQQQIATLTRDEYGTTLRMGFAFPSANDYMRVGTTVSLAADERSAKVSFKSTETLRHAGRDLKVEGEQTLIFKVQDDKPAIVSLEQVMPGDST